MFCFVFKELFLEPSDNLYKGCGDAAYLNGQIRMAFIRGNEHLTKSGGLAFDGTILTGVCVISGGESFRDTFKAVST